MTRVLLTFGLAFASASNAFAFDKQSHFWEPTFIAGYDGPLERTIPEGYVAYEDAGAVSKLLFQTAYNSQTEEIIGVKFFGCLGVSNLKYAAFENEWAGVVVRPACTLLLQKTEPPNPGQIVERSESYRHDSEDQFLALSPDFADLIVDWSGKSLRYVDASGEILVSFKLREAAE